MPIDGHSALNFKECKKVSWKEAELLQLVLPILAELPDLKLAIAYGSIANGRMRSDSDVDIAVLFSQAMTAEKKMQIADLLSGRLGREIDLVDLFSLNGVILQQILCKGKLLFKKSTAIYEAIIKRMLYNQEDMMPYVRRTLLERQRRFING